MGQALAVRRPALQATAQVLGVLALARAHVGFPSPCPYVQMKLVFSAPTHDWQGGSYGSRAGRFCCSQLISSIPSGFRSDINAKLMQDVCFPTRDGKLFFSFWERISTFRQVCGKICLCTERWHLDQATGYIDGHSGWLLAHVSDG